MASIDANERPGAAVPALRDYQQIAYELERRYGWKLDRREVWYLCRRAERKIAKAMAGDGRQP